MEKETKPSNIEKFMNIEENKKDRILNAAMKELRYGYKRASTDNIVKEAGISKGLLFHYFGSKIQLYEFVVRYVHDLSFKDYYKLLDMEQRDILEIFWQSALIKKDLADRYPYIYDFADGIYAHREDLPGNLIFELIKEGEANFQEIIDKCDMNLFRDDIDAIRAIDLIFWSFESMFQYKNMSKNFVYEEFLSELQAYMDIFRKCFYKPKENNVK